MKWPFAFQQAGKAIQRYCK